MDVDHFKRYNDQHGHQAGDDCLGAVARVIAAQAQRSSDLAARYGGEEFVLLLPGTDAAGCEQVGERIRQALHGLQLPHATNPPSRCVTISLGGATGWPSTGKPADIGWSCRARWSRGPAPKAPRSLPGARHCRGAHSLEDREPPARS